MIIKIINNNNNNSNDKNNVTGKGRHDILVHTDDWTSLHEPTTKYLTQLYYYYLTRMTKIM